MSEVTLLTGDCMEQMVSLPDASVNCCVTSPPYWGLRDYGHDGQIGLEESPDAYIVKMVAVFGELRRVLRGDGTLWLNLGDSYASSTKGSGGSSDKQLSNAGSRYENCRNLKHGLKPKDLVGIPWRVALALRADGWWLRQDIIWHKPNPMPESVTDRCTKAHEYIFLLSKSARYYYDSAAIAEAAATPGSSSGTLKKNASEPTGKLAGYNHSGEDFHTGTTRNRRSVWTVATQPYKGAHFATFPPDLIRPCILAGCPAKVCALCGAPWERVVERTAMVIDRSARTHDKGRTRSSGTMVEPPTSRTTGFRPTCDCDSETASGTVLDPFSGSGTTGFVAAENGRKYIGIELNPEYQELARQRIAAAQPPLFAPGRKGLPCD